MDGEFYTDITRDTFKKKRHFSRVLMQQGRVQLDADWNEQTDLLLHYIRTLAADILGPHAGPNDGFQITPYHDTSNNNIPFEFLVAEGRYYVDGILTENDHEQYIHTIPQDERPTVGTASLTYLFYLDVWEHEVTYIEDDQIREAALGGPDTATRSEVIWKITTFTFTQEQLGAINKGPDCLTPNGAVDWTCWLSKHFRVNHGFMKAHLMDIDKLPPDPCITAPTAQFRGLENQLYRIEIHHSGEAWPEHAETQGGRRRTTSDSGPLAISGNYATFKWSRENGSIVFPIVGIVGSGTITQGSTITVTLQGLGRDQGRFSLVKDDWVELVDLEDDREGRTGPLLQVQLVDQLNMQVTLLTKEDITFDADTLATGRQLLRRWDQKESDPNQTGAITLAPDGAAKLFENKWLTLEHGIQILFHRDKNTGTAHHQADNKDADDTPPKYSAGDYWLIPARTATGDIEWPHKGKEYYPLPPHGVQHHYAPLAIVRVNQNGDIQEGSLDLRRQINEIGKPLV